MVTAVRYSATGNGSDSAADQVGCQVLSEHSGEVDEVERTGEKLNIVFSDERRFCLGRDSMRVSVRPGQCDDTVTIQLPECPLGAVVWGWIGNRPDLVMMPHDINAADYQAAERDSRLEGQAKAKYGRNIWFFMQDGASIHTSMPTIEAIGPY
jgi:hypothetical protein